MGVCGMPCVSTCLIVGGGIAGLSASIALSRAGVQCDVVELAAEPLGASLGISGRAAEALAELGVYDACYAEATPFTAESTALTMMGPDGTVISAGPQRPAAHPGAKTAIGIYRPVLLAKLAAEAERLGVTIRRGLTAKSIDDQPDAAHVTLSNGEQQEYDLVVGADGIGSATRASVFPDARPTYAGQMSLRWMAPGPAVQPEGWYFGPLGRLGFYHLPQGMVYMPAVITSPEPVWLNDEDARALLERLLDSYTAPAVVELRSRLSPGSEVIGRPFEWILLPQWHRGRTLLIGDAAHATTAHLGQGGGMALEDAVVLGQCIAAASSLDEAFRTFMTRRFDRTRTVVESSVALSRLEIGGAPRSANVELMGKALQALSQPY
jgi:2-polyprenyl-6-methoxyphenol hydroxylase-like FAD-dependent oxidoreductase